MSSRGNHPTLVEKDWRSDATALLLSCELKRKKPVRQKQEDFHHNVYVILLRNTVGKHSSILRLNPKRDPVKP
ncbi:MAG TPA: hypothetical protein VKD89_05255, partial [Candidatus Udaeobacter sp.]|nr:hypothetical protein [Candidatus Udaeobacter sp.]